MSYRPLAPDYSVGLEAIKPLALLALISGENQTGEQNADVAATTVPSRAPRESQREEGPVNRAAYASVGETGWLRRKSRPGERGVGACFSTETAHN